MAHAPYPPIVELLGPEDGAGPESAAWLPAELSTLPGLARRR